MWDHVFADLAGRRDKGIGILPFPHPILSRPALSVTAVNESIHKLIDLMFDILSEYGGIGLAAPQMGIPLQIFVTHITRPLVFINPVLSSPRRTRGFQEEVEGCLSIPGFSAPVIRPTVVNVSWMDRDGKQQKQQYSGLQARCCQHESDHLHGRLFVNYLVDPGIAKPWLDYLQEQFSWMQMELKYFGSAEEMNQQLDELEKFLRS